GHRKTRGLRPERHARRSRRVRPSNAAARLPPLLARRRNVGAQLRPVPLGLARRVRSHGAARRDGVERALGGLGSLPVHGREPQARLRLAEAVIELRPCESDEDLEAWRRVRIAVVPYERTESVEELRRAATPERLLLLAYRDGELAGSGVGGRGDTGRGFAAPRVLPEHRRRGVGTALLHALAQHAEALGLSDLGVKADDEIALAFAQRFGFEEVGREVEQVR